MRAWLSAGFVSLLLCSGVQGQTRIEVDNEGVRVDPAEKVDPQYGKTLQERSDQGREKAEQTGKSHIDSLHGPFPELPDRGQAKPREALETGRVGPVRKAVGGRAEVGEQRGGSKDQGQPAGSYDRLDEIKGGELHELIAELLKLWNRPPEMVRLQRREPRGGERSRPVAESPKEAQVSAGVSLPAVAVGQGLYARMLYAVNSDYPGPVLLEILETPLVGAVASGAFERIGERLVIRLDSVAWRGRREPVQAWAVGLDCACFGVEGEVDRHWWERLILPAAVRFAEGFLTARGTPGRRVRVSGETVVEESSGPTDRQAIYRGLGEAARSAGDILLQDAPTGPTIRIPRDAEVAVVFERPPGGRANVVGATEPSPRRPPVTRVSGTANDSADDR